MGLVHRTNLWNAKVNNENKEIKRYFIDNNNSNKKKLQCLGYKKPKKA